MSRSDVHVHLGTGQEDPVEMLKAMDSVGTDRAVIISVYPADAGKDKGFGLGQVHVTNDPQVTLDNCKFLSKFCSAAPDRLIGFVWIEPRLAQAPLLVKQCLDMPGVRGVKMIPNHWYPYEERIFPAYAAVQDANAPILFHSGILFGFVDSSRFCRPCYYEALLHFPKVRFALAHISWPWTDECIATAGRFRAAVRRGERSMQMWIDLTPGTPEFYRKDAIDKALKYLGPERLLWGTDTSPANYANYGKEVKEMDRKILEEELKLDSAALEKIYHKNLDDLLGQRRP